MNYRTPPQVRERSVKVPLTPPTGAIAIAGSLTLIMIADVLLFARPSAGFVAVSAVVFVLASVAVGSWWRAKSELQHSVEPLNVGTEPSNDSLQTPRERLDRRQTLARWAGVIIGLTLYIAFNLWFASITLR